MAALTGEMNRAQLQAELKLAHRDHFTMAYLLPALSNSLIEMTLPDKPSSKNQRYRRTAQGEALAVQIKRTNGRVWVLLRHNELASRYPIFELIQGDNYPDTGGLTPLNSVLSAAIRRDCE